MRIANILAWILPVAVFCALAMSSPVQAMEKLSGSLELEEAVRHLCDDVIQGASPDLARLRAVVDAVRANQGGPYGLFRHHGAPGAYLGFSMPMPLRQLARYLFNPEIPQNVIKPFSIRTSTWITAGINDEQRVFWADPWPPQDMVVLRGTQFDRTTPDPSTGGCYAMRLERVMIFLPQDQAIISVSVQPEDSEVGVKGYALGEESLWRYVYTPEMGLTRAGLGWVSSRIQTNVSIGVYLAGDDQATLCGVLQWMRAGWSGLSVVQERHIADSLVRYDSLLSTWLQRLPEPDRLEALFRDVNRLDDNALRTAIRPVLEQWRDQAYPADSKHVLGLLENGYEQSLDREELLGLLVVWRLWQGA